MTVLVTGAARLLGYASRTPFAEGIARFVEENASPPLWPNGTNDVATATESPPAAAP